MQATARDWMSTRPKTVSPRLPVTDLASLFSSRRITSVPVVDKGKVVGMVSRSDLVSAFACEHNLGDSMLADLSFDEHSTLDERAMQLADFVGRRMEGKCVADVMSAHAVSVQADDTLSLVAQRMVENQIHHMPVLEGEELTGMISTFDIARWAAN